MNLKDTYNLIAENWHKEHETDTWWIPGTEQFLSHLTPGSAILDAGCGGGTKSRFFVERGFRVFGIDFSERMIEIARREVPSAHFEVMDLNDVRDLARTFDAVFAEASVVHLPKSDVQRVLEGFADVLAPGGFLYVSVKEKRTDQNEEETKVEEDYGFQYERFFNYFLLDELRERIVALGMDVVSATVHPVNRTRWIQIIGCKK